MPKRCAMKYFREKRRKYADPCYYWEGKPRMKNYGLPVIEALGKDYLQAVERWKELFCEYERRRKEQKMCGTYTNEDCKMLLNRGSLMHMAELYYKDRRFIRLADKTKKDYKVLINRIINKLLYPEQKKPLGTLKVSAIDRPFVKKLYENLLEKGAKRSASLIINALSQLIITASDYGYYKQENPCKKLVLEKNSPRSQFWTLEEVKLFYKTAKAKGYQGLALAVLIAYYTAQRQTDIENLQWKDFDKDFNFWKIKQSKTKAYVNFPIYKTPFLQKILKTTQKINDYVCNSYDGKPYQGRDLIPEQCKKIIELAGIRKELVFRDLRRTAILRLDEAGCTMSEIASISGHSRKSILDIIETYAPNSIKKAESALDKVNSSFSGV